MKLRMSIALMLASFQMQAQQILTPENQYPKKIISKYEIVAGPGLLLNYGNKELVHDRAFKLGYTVGVGAYHTFSDRWELNVRALWERNGDRTKSRVNANIGLDEIIETELINDYYTFILAPNFLLGNKKKIKVGIGGYFSLLNNSHVAFTEYLNGQVKIKTLGNSISGYEKKDIGMNISCGYDLLINKYSISLQLIDKLGIVNINRPLLPITVEKNHVIFLLVVINLRERKANKI